MKHSALDLGTIGEYICAVRMLKSGIPCKVVNFETTDVVGYHEDRLIRIQVKSSTLKKNRPASRNGYQFNLGVGGKQKRVMTSADCDVIALVAIEQEQVIFFPQEKLQQKTKRLSPKRFDNDDVCLSSWNRTMSHLFD